MENGWKRIELLEDILNSSKEYEFTENENGDILLKVRKYYDTKEVIYINFYELIHLLKHYTATDRVLLYADEVEEE